MAGFVVLDSVLRQFHAAFGGSEELASYTIALATSWGLGYALSELGPIRIDLRPFCHHRHERGRRHQLLASGVAGHRKRQPREYPDGHTARLGAGALVAGWVWFAVMACLVTAAALSLVLRRRDPENESFVGVFADQDTLK
ncbi:MAG: TRAP transporter small permease [Pseudomonadota bacterium]